MDTKLIAIGSRIMGDDGAAIAVAEALCSELEKEGIRVVMGETDVEYCLNLINAKDCIIILDAAISGKSCGTVWMLPLNEAINTYSHKQYQHDFDLLSEIKRRGLCPTGLLICIEAADICLSIGFSEILQNEFHNICKEVKKIITQFRGDKEYA